MTMAEYTSEISFALGGSVVELEIEKDLERCVNKAFRLIKSKITTPRYMTVNYIRGATDGTIDLSNKDVYSIVSVMRTHNYNSLSMNTLDVFGLNQTYSAITNMNSYMQRMLRLQQINTISSDLDFIWEANTKQLHITMNPPYTNQVTIEYIPDYKSVEEITEVYWEDKILQLATAYAKQVLGRIRSKYKLNSSQYELDGDTLLAEANTEIENIINFLNENVDIAFPMD